MPLRAAGMDLPEGTPVLVGIGVAQQKCSDAREAEEAIALMHQATDAALQDCQAPGIGAGIGLVAVPRGMWNYSNPAALLADGIGAAGAQTLLADFGIMQQTLIGEACRRIADGEFDAALVVGGEAKYRQQQAKIHGVEVDDTAQTESVPDIFLQPGAELWSEIEAGAGLGLPVGYYAIIETALCHAAGQGMDAHRDTIAQIYGRFSEIAAGNPDAWSAEVVQPDAIRNAGEANRMLAFPYTRRHNSQWNVDQAAALLLCSVAKAKQMGVPQERWVFPLASTESNHTVNVSQRPALHRSAGARLAGQRALELTGLEIADIEFLELYSCFPAAVNLFASELAVPADRDLTVTGGMPFAGGPLNNFVLQATVKLAQCLRKAPGSSGLVTCVSGMFTKQAYGLWSTTPGARGFAFEDVSEAVAREEIALELVRPVAGEVTVVAHTVLVNPKAPDRLVVIGEYADGRRTVSWSEDQKVVGQFALADCVGRTLLLDDAGKLCRSYLESRERRRDEAKTLEKAEFTRSK